MCFGSAVLLLSLVALLHSRRPPTPSFTYGFARMEVLAAFTNGVYLLFLAFSFALEASGRAALELEKEGRERGRNRLFRHTRTTKPLLSLPSASLTCGIF